MTEAKAANKAEILQAMQEGYILIYSQGWYYLVKGNKPSIKINCNSAHAVLRDKQIKLHNRLADAWDMEN